jgi:CxxC-x17-CxxC domain-containing protein
MSSHPAEHQTCRDCGHEFLFSPAEREFRLAHNMSAPDRCPTCRGRERQARNADLISLYEQSATREFGVTSDAARSGGRRRDRGAGRSPGGPRQMYNTVCANCGAETQVPFVPRGDRPVYCRDCYNARNGR